MTDQLLTKCPHCGTTFRLTQAQLSIAGGAVRCGACYQVFHAKEHIVRTAVVEEIIPPPPPPPPDPFKQGDASSEPNPYENLDWELNAEDHPDADLFAENYELPDLEKELEAELQNLGFEADEITPPAKPKPKGSVDEDWAKQLLAEMGEEDVDEIDDTLPPGKRRAAKPAKSGELSDSFLELGSSSAREDVFGLEDDEKDSAGDSDELWAQKLLDDLESEGKPKKTGRHELAIEKDEPAPAKPAPSKAEPKSASSADDENGFGELLDTLDGEPASAETTPAPVRKPKPPVGGESLLDNLKAKADNLQIDELPDLAGIDDFDTDKLEVVGDPKRKVIQGKRSTGAMEDHALVLERPRIIVPALRFLAWTVVNLVLAAVLVIQYAFFNLATLAEHTAYRPYLSLMCEQLGCKLPLQVDTDQIRVSRLVVRPHATEPSALAIDAIIMNRAPFTQPYPVIELVFKDINDKIVAGRRFAPRSYIANPDIDLRSMPPETPVRVLIEILDPGRQAVNYQMTFQPSMR